MINQKLSADAVKTTDITEHRAKIAIIGAGFAGLGLAEAFIRYGIEYDQFDQNDKLGGIWYKGAYPGVHLITPKQATGYASFPMPDEYPDYPDGVAVERYLHAFAEKHRLQRNLKCNSTVTSIRPEGDGVRWSVCFANGEKYTYDGVVAATGNHGIPHIPKVEGQFDGHQFHSRDYCSPKMLKGKRVLVVGGGNSAADIAIAAARFGKSAHLSTRNGRWILPKCLLGRPTGSILKSWMPLWFLRLFIRTLLAISVGDYRKYGLQNPKHRLFEQEPTISDQLLHHLRHGKITPHPGIYRLCGNEVEFTNGHRNTYDIICWATGFQVELPYVDKEVMDIQNNNLMAIAGMFPRQHRNFYLFGMGHFTRPIPRYGVGPMISAGADILALSILAQRRLRKPLGTLLARMIASPPKPCSVNPTSALLCARFLAWCGETFLTISRNGR